MSKYRNKLLMMRLKVMREESEVRITGFVVSQLKDVNPLWLCLNHSSIRFGLANNEDQTRNDTLTSHAEPITKWLCSPMLLKRSSFPLCMPSKQLNIAHSNGHTHSHEQRHPWNINPGISGTNIQCAVGTTDINVLRGHNCSGVSNSERWREWNDSHN